MFNNNKRIKLIAGIIALALAVIMIFSTVLTGLYAVAAEPDAETTESTDIEEYKSELATLEKKQAAVKEEISKLDDQLADASAKKSAIDRQMELTQKDIETTKALLAEMNTQIAQKATELDKATAELAEKEELYRTRARVMYESGGTTYLDVLLSSSEFSDMLSRVEVVGQIMAYDKQIVSDYKAAKQDVEEKKAILEQQQAEKEDYQDELETSYADLQTQQSKSQTLLDNLNNNVTAKQDEATKMEEDAQKATDEIARLSAVEAEKKAQEAAAAQQMADANVGTATVQGGTSGFSGTFTWPAPEYTRISSPYGYRDCPYHGQELHSGVDLAAPEGSPVLAAAGGTVIKSYYSTSFGNYIVVSHGNGTMTGYAHMSERLVSEGDTVVQGQTIGYVGSTGNSTGNHLHFQVFIDGDTTDPMVYFPDKEAAD